jgi:ribosome biogenesis GTPase YqeH
MTGRACSGCGAPILEDSIDSDKPLCKRCFRIKHYNEALPTDLATEEFTQIINRINFNDSVVLHIVDLFDLAGTLVTTLPRYIAGNPYILIANKIDLFARNITHERMQSWLSQYVKSAGLHPEQIFLTSVSKGFHLDPIVKYINKTCRNKEIYVVGATNVGKSTFINELLKRLNIQGGEITTSHFPGTTLDLIKLPIGNGCHIIDTPELILQERYSDFLGPESLKEITPKNTIKPAVYQLNGEQTLFWGGLARIDQLSSSKNSFVCYRANSLPIRRTKLANADELYSKHLGEMLSPPRVDELSRFAELKKTTYHYDGKQKIDIVISGLGWVTISGEPTDIAVHVPKGVSVERRKSLV